VRTRRIFENLENSRSCNGSSSWHASESSEKKVDRESRSLNRASVNGAREGQRNRCISEGQGSDAEISDFSSSY
jgi:hypothetical protein